VTNRPPETVETTRASMWATNSAMVTQSVYSPKAARQPPSDHWMRRSVRSRQDHPVLPVLHRRGCCVWDDETAPLMQELGPQTRGDPKGWPDCILTAFLDATVGAASDLDPLGSGPSHTALPATVAACVAAQLVGAKSDEDIATAVLAGIRDRVSLADGDFRRAPGYRLPQFSNLRDDRSRGKREPSSGRGHGTVSKAPRNRPHPDERSQHQQQLSPHLPHPVRLGCSPRSRGRVARPARWTASMDLETAA